MKFIKSITMLYKEPKVLVLLSSYNGGKYLQEQIDSILNQKDVNVFVLVRDDGSTDNTLDLLRQMVACNPLRLKLVEGKLLSKLIY